MEAWKNTHYLQTLSAGDSFFKDSRLESFFSIVPPYILNLISTQTNRCGHFDASPGTKQSWTEKTPHLISTQTNRETLMNWKGSNVIVYFFILAVYSPNVNYFLPFSCPHRTVCSLCHESFTTRGCCFVCNAELTRLGVTWSQLVRRNSKTLALGEIANTEMGGKIVFKLK